MVNQNWPLTVTQFSTADPFDFTAAPAWNAFNPQPEAMTASGGRQYELNMVQAGEATYSLFDQAESLNPANTASPFYPNIKPMRQIVDQTMWPPVPVGGAVNLLNLSALPVAYDPTFESYTAAPSWLTGVGGAAPSITTTTPFQGAQCATWATATNSTQQGCAAVVPCIPGQQYTLSGYVRQSVGNTLQAYVTGLSAAQDSFARVVSNGWGAADSGQAWSILSGTAADFAVNGSIGTMTHAAASADHSMKLPLGLVDMDVRVNLDKSAGFISGGNLVSYVDVRMVDPNNLYRVNVRWRSADQASSLEIVKVVAGTPTTLVAQTLVPGASNAAALRVRVNVTGTVVQAKAWVNDGVTAEPSTWLVTATDTAITGTGDLRLASFRDVGNTNNPTTFRYGALTVAGSVGGPVTNVVGSYVRLSATFTATQTSHVVEFATAGGVSAGSTFLDAVQLEPGASASTFSATGPNIFTVFGGYIERWPRSWKDGGVRGQASLTAVDPLAVLAGQYLQTEYRNAVMATAPDFYWPLNEGSSAAVFADASGKNQIPLGTFTSAYGPAANGFTTGSTVGIPGDPGGVGVEFVPDVSTLSAPKAKWLAMGNPLATVPTPVALPPVIGAPWSITVAGWFKMNQLNFSLNYPVFWLQSLVNQSGGLGVAPIVVLADANVWYSNSLSGTPLSCNSGYNNGYVLDGNPHHIVGVVTQDGTNTTVTKYVDGVLDSTSTKATSAVGGLLPMQASTIAVGGQQDKLTGFPSVYLVNGWLSHVALWNRALSAGEISGLWNAGTGYPGESSGTRAKRYLSGWNGPVAVDNGMSSMGVSNLAANTATLTALQSVTTSENGRLFADPTNGGAPTFQARSHDYFATSAKWVLGELELPYEEDISYDYDPQQVFTDVRVNRVNGATAVGGSAAAIASASHASGTRSYQRQVNTSSDLEAIDAANWIFNGHSSAVQRLAKLTIKPSSNPALWPMALSARIGDRITVHRRTSSGTAMQADFYIEKISHSRKVSDENMEWTVSFEASPVSANRQPWILGDATYSVLGTTTVLGY